LLAPVAAAAAVSLTLVGYGVMSPRSQLFGPQLWRLEREGKNCALTFDDGPQEPYTSRLLDLLAAEGVAATFFVLGRQVERYPEVLDRLRREGHEVGIHGYSHAAVPLLSRARIAEELDRTLGLVAGARLVRPPYGWKDRRLFRLAAERGLRVVGWSAQGGDWRRRTGQQIAGRILRRVRPGAIVLLHDGCGEDPAADRSGTILATATLIRELRDQGFGFVTLKGC
jgi:peptidoglycan/xylan/chitin deacetylase (PgdA/CDA1 family)